MLRHSTKVDMLFRCVLFCFARVKVGMYIQTPNPLREQVGMYIQTLDPPTDREQL